MKTKVKFYALLLAVALFFASLFGLGGALRVHASDGLPAGAEVEPSLYYITDRAESREYFDLIAAATGASGERGHFIYIQPQDFWHAMRQMYQSGYFFGIENAFFVLEVRSGFPQDVLAPVNEDEECFSDQIFEMLYEIFVFLDSNGCRTMFICGTDESRFSGSGKNLPYPQNEFLYYVDIHVNDDLCTMYHYTAIKRMEETLCGVTDNPEADEWKETVILLDVSLGDSWDFLKTLIKYFAVTYQSDLTNFAPEMILNQMGVKVFFSRGLGDFVDPFAYTDDPYDGFYDVWENAEKAFVIARRDGDLYGEYEYLLHYRTEKADRTYLYPFDYAWGRIDAYLPDIMQDFSLGTREDLKYWDWYHGEKRCDITFKPIEYSGNGWLYRPVNVPWLDLLFDARALYDKEGIEELIEFLNSSAPDYAIW